MDKLKAYFQRDTFAAHLGIELLEVSPGRAVARMRIGPDHLNSVGMAHGGAIFSLADLVFAAASNAHGQVAVALSASISFLRPGAEGSVLTATAEEVSFGRRIATYQITVTDAEDAKVAMFQGTVYRKSDPIDLPE